MNIKRTKYCCRGFSLIEMLIATGIMAIGLVLVSTIFPVGVKLTTLTTERSIAAVAADEAFAKIRLYGLRNASLWPAANPDTECSDFRYAINYDENGDGVVDASDAYITETWADFAYPSGPTVDDSKYCWSALCRQVSSNDIQVTVFVSRMMASGIQYHNLDYDGSGYDWITSDVPMPVRVNVEYTFNSTDDSLLRELVLDMTGADNSQWGDDVYSFIDEGYTIISDRDGAIYQVEEMKDVDGDRFRETILLRQDWQLDDYSSNGTYDESIWVVPPAVGSSRYPCVGVYQQVIRFD